MANEAAKPTPIRYRCSSKKPGATAMMTRTMTTYARAIRLYLSYIDLAFANPNIENGHDCEGQSRNISIILLKSYELPSMCWSRSLQPQEDVS